MKALLFVFLSAGLMSCSTLRRSSNSGYVDYDQSSQIDSANEYYQAQEFEEDHAAREELGLSGNRSLNEIEKNAVLRRLRLKQLEAQIETNDEKRQYYELKPLLRNDNERIYFLSLPSMTARARWASQAQLKSRAEAFTPFILQAIEKNDIIAGMTKKAVQESWGDPDYVEVAGNDIYGNERWNYLKYISSADGYKKERRIIYFESGKVAGWERY